MKYFNFDEIETTIKESTLLIIGRFESFHRGHMHLIKKAIDYAKINNLKVVLMMFPEHEGDLLSFEERKLIIEKLNIDYVMIFAPTKKNYSLSIESFAKLIIEKYNTKMIFAGNDFTFNKTDDDYSLLKEHIDITLIERIKINNQIISTSLIKEALKSSEIDLVKKLLGFNYFYMGRVIPGNQIGFALGFPTANIDYNQNKVNVGEGIYLSYLIYDGKKYPSLTSISTNPTIEDISYLKYETHVLNFKENLYGKVVRIELIKLLRRPKKFPGKVELLRAMNHDKEQAITYFIGNKK